MGKFSKIKKYNLKSLSIDEKIKFLDKEMEKTGLNEVAANSTAGVYVSTPTAPNQNFNNFNGLNHGGYPLGLSGADGNSTGGGTIGVIPAGQANAGLAGVALSPPHPITGQRTAARHIKDGVGFSTPLRPGKSVIRGFFTSTVTTMGGALWFFDSNYNFAGQQGRWLNFEWFNGGWGFWDTNFLGFYFHNQNLDEYELNGVNIGTQIKNKITGIDFGDNGSIGTADTIVLTQNKVDDPSFLPINIDGLSTQGYNYLKGKAGVEEDPDDAAKSAYYKAGGQMPWNYLDRKQKEYWRNKVGKGSDIAGVYDLMKRGQVPFLTPSQVDKILVDPKYQQLLQDDPDILKQLQRMRAMADDGVEIASTDPSAAFPSAPVDPPVYVDASKITSADIIDELEDDEKPSAKGVKLTKWISRTDFMKKYPDSSVTEYLDALPYGPSDFMTPNSKYKGAWDLNTKGFEDYFMKGNLSALGNSSGKPKPRHTEATPDPEPTKKSSIFTDAVTKLGNFAIDPLQAVADFFGNYLTPPAAEYSTNIAKSVAINKPITVKQEDIPKGDIDKFFKNFGYQQPLPISIGKPVPYADDNFYADEKGNIKSNIGPNGEKGFYKKNNTGDMGGGKGVAGYGNPLAAAGQAQTQFVIPDDGSEPYFQYTDHAYHNLTSDDKGEVPDPIKKALSGALHALTGKGDPTKPNTGGMSGYPPNVKGDVKTEFKIPYSKLPENIKKRVDFERRYQELVRTGQAKAKFESFNLSKKKPPEFQLFSHELDKEKLLSEATKLGYFDPEVLTVDIEKLRKGILPVFPKKAPPEMIDGYSEKSQLAPKKAEREPFIKITKKDLAKNHKLKDSEIKEFLDTFKKINDFIKKHPEELIYAQQRYPVGDKRLAQLNWKMDQMLEAGEEYLDTQFPENQRLVDRIKKATKKTMELTNPEAYKGLNKPDMELMSLDDHMKQKRVVSRHFKKKRQSKSMFRVDMNKVKEKNRKVAEQKVAEWQEKRRIELLNSNEFEDKKYDWRKEIGEDFANTTQGMKVGQTFTHVPSGQTVTTSGILGGIETLQTSVPIFGDAIPGPDASQYGLQGFAKPIDMMRRGDKKTEQLNKELDSSEEYTKKVKADEYMKARVTGELSLEQKKEFVEIYKNNLEEWNKKSAEISRENIRRRKSNVSKVRSFVSKFGANLDTIKGVQTFIKITQGGKKLVVIHQNNMFRDFSDKFNVRVYEAKEGKKISKLSGNFGRVDSSMFDNPFTNRKSSGEATIMYDNVGGEVESKTFAIKELPPIPMPTPPKFMQKNIDKGWQPSVTSSFDQEFINKMKIFAGKNFVSSLGGSNFAAQLAVQLAQGDLSPVTKSPGPAVTNIIKSNIEFVMSTGETKDLPDFDDKGNKLDPDLKKNHSFFNPITGRGAVRYNAYGDYGVASAPVSASLGQYSIERTDKGIRISDKFDISSGFTAPGGAAYFNGLTQLVGGKDVQSTGETLTAIAARRAAELGYDMVDADTGETLKPVYSGEEEFNSRNFPNSGAPTIATPKGFNIKIDFTIPWSSFSPETATLLKIGGSKKVDPLQTKTDRTGYGYDTKGKLDSSGYGMDPNRDTETEARPIKSSKAVNRIKNMAKARRQSLSLDKPIVKRKNKKS